MDDSYARLFSYAIDTDVTLEEMLKCDDEHHLSVHFAIPLSKQAYDEFRQIQGVLLDLQLQSDYRGNRDVWAFLRINGVYASAAYYKFMFDYLNVDPISRSYGRASVCTNRKYSYGCFW
jgi:hypothetical protein